MIKLYFNSYIALQLKGDELTPYSDFYYVRMDYPTFRTFDGLTCLWISPPGLQHPYIHSLRFTSSTSLPPWDLNRLNQLRLYSLYGLQFAFYLSSFIWRLHANTSAQLYFSSYIALPIKSNYSTNPDRMMNSPAVGLQLTYIDQLTCSFPIYTPWVLLRR